MNEWCRPCGEILFVTPDAHASAGNPVEDDIGGFCWSRAGGIERGHVSRRQVRADAWS